MARSLGGPGHRRGAAAGSRHRCRIAVGVALAVLLVGFGAVNTTNGAVTIAPPVDDGVFTARTAVATMLVGGIVSVTVSTFKCPIPVQFEVWARSSARRSSPPMGR